MLTVIPSAARNLLLALRSAATKGLGRWVLILTGLVVCGVLFLTYHREALTPLPPPVAQRVEQHRIQSAVDSVAIRRVTRAAAKEHVKSETAVARSREAADSGNYRQAYVVEDSAVLALDHEVALLDVALTKSESRAIQADSVIAAVLPIAESREPPCRLVWIVPCPTRRAVALVAAALTTTAFVAAPRILRL